MPSKLILRVEYCPQNDFLVCAWQKLKIPTSDVPLVMERKPLRQSWLSIRLKTLRSYLLSIAGEVIEHGGGLFLKITQHHPNFLLHKKAVQKLLVSLRFDLYHLHRSKEAFKKSKE